MKFFYLLMLMFLIFSCSDFTKGKQIKELTRMKQTIDSIETVLIEHKYEELDRYYKDALIVKSRIKENYYSDTISIEFAQKLDRYKLLMNQTPEIKKAYVKLLKSTDSERELLEKLISDINESNGDRSAYEDYILKEHSKINLLRNNLITYVEKRDESITIYQSLHDEIYRFSFDLITN